MFEDDPQDPWVKETLAWWNEYVFSVFLLNYYSLCLYLGRCPDYLRPLLGAKDDPKRTRVVSTVESWTLSLDAQPNALPKLLLLNIQHLLPVVL
jgi:hypothetical protein